MNEEEVRIAKETLEALFSDSTGEDYPYTEKFVQAVNTGIQALEELEQYRALGTVEELKEAREKQISMKIEEIHVDEYYCPACGSELNCNDARRVEDKYCSECGQRFEVSEEDD